MPLPNPPRMPSAEDIAALRIRYERVKRNWSADELAKQMTDAGCPVNQSAIWRIENSAPRRKISLDEAVAFAKVFGITVDDLMWRPTADAIADEMAKILTELQDWQGEARRLAYEIGRIREAAEPTDLPEWARAMAEFIDGLTSPAGQDQPTSAPAPHQQKSSAPAASAPQPSAPPPHPAES